ncbi:MAG: hypothetical protein JSR77_00910 [Planctomycetes bacterium]|nr:hypothetical protein [Planctomycetota bacterium]
MRVLTSFVPLLVAFPAFAQPASQAVFLSSGGTLTASGDLVVIGHAFIGRIESPTTSAHLGIVPILTSGDAQPCYADFNQDGGIDGTDVEAFFYAWEGGNAASDVNQDGGIDGADVETFFAAWEAGGCG